MAPPKDKLNGARGRGKAVPLWEPSDKRPGGAPSHPALPAGRRPGPTAGPTSGRTTKRPTPRALQLVDYPEDTALVDHKGRAKPLYQPRSPRPVTWRPSHPARLLLGAIPGVRIMAIDEIRRGLPYLVLGVVALILAILLAVGGPRYADALSLYRIDQRWMLVHGLAVLAAVTIYELLRLASSREDRTKEPWAPRVIATAFVPAAVVLVAAPDLVGFAPRLVEAGWFAAAVVAVGTAPAALWTVLGGAASGLSPRRVVIGTLGVVAVALLITWLVGGSGLLGSWGDAAAARGFVVLPEILSRR